MPQEHAYAGNCCPSPTLQRGKSEAKKRDISQKVFAFPFVLGLDEARRTQV